MTLGRNLRFAALAFMLWSLAYNLMAPLLPLYAQELGASPLGIGAVGSAGALGALLLILPLSRVSDRAGRRPALLAGWTISAVGFLLMFLAPSWLALLPGAFLSTGALAALPTLNTLALEELAANQRTRGFSLIYAASPLGALLGSAVAGVLGAGYGLRAGAAAAGLSVLIATLALLPIVERREALEAPAPAGGERGPARASGLASIVFAAAGAGGFLLLAVPGNFVVPYLHDVAGRGLIATGLYSSLLFGAQFAWSLLFSVWPRRTDWVRVGTPRGGFSFPAATLMALAVCLAANAAFGLLLPLGATGLISVALVLRGSQYTLQSLGSALLGDVVAPGPGRTTRLTLFSAILGVGAAGAPVVGGWLYGLGPSYPFWFTGIGAAAGAVVLPVVLRALPRTAGPALVSD